MINISSNGRTALGTSALCAVLWINAISDPPALAAQGWSLHAALGQVESNRLPPDGSAGMHVGAVWRGGRSWMSLMGGAPFDSHAPSWGAASGGTQLSLLRSGPALLGWDLALSGYVYRGPEPAHAGIGGTLETGPSGRLRLGRATITAASGPALYAARDGGSDFRRAVLSSRLELSVAPVAGLQIGGYVRHVLAEEGGYPFAAANASLSRGPFRAWTTAGRWLAADLDDPLLRAGARLALGDRLGISVRYDVDPADPLIWNEPRRGFSVGADLRLSPPRAVRRGPTSPIETNGETVFRVPHRSDRAAVWIVGDFTNWERVPLEREDEHWRVSLRIPPGVHHFSFVDDRDRWFLPPGVSTVDDGMGGESGVLVID